LSFLTLFGRASAPNRNTLAWFPVAGALIGLALGAIWWLAAEAWPPMIAAAVVVVADLVITGCLHFDGLADAADGLLAPMSRERRLQAMADPAIGAFGAVGVGAILLLRFGSLAALRPAPLMLGGLWCASRTSMAIMTQTLTYVRPTGLVRDFIGAQPRGVLQRAVLPGALVAGLFLSVALVVGGRGGRGLLALGGELVAMSAVAEFSRRRIGGFTGDVLGAAGVMGETVGLLILVAR
jgi:adenosylcobinamide-GDP ribazoletransferase